MPLSIMGVWKNNKKSIVDECESHMTLFVQALSLELAALAIIVPFGTFLEMWCTCMFPALHCRQASTDETDVEP